MCVSESEPTSKSNNAITAFANCLLHLHSSIHFRWLCCELQAKELEWPQSAYAWTSPFAQIENSWNHSGRCFLHFWRNRCGWYFTLLAISIYFTFLNLWFRTGSFCDDLYEFSPSTNKWTDLTKIASGPFPVARSEHCAASSDTAFFVYGGQYLGGNLGDFFKFDIANLSWTLLDTPPGPAPGRRFRCSMTFNRNYLFLTGGYSDWGEK